VHLPASDATLHECLASPDFPWGTLLRSDAHERVVTVTDFRRFAVSRGLSPDETELDAFVERLGGKRQSMIDPWSAPVRWLQRLRGRPTQTTDLYATPHGAEPAAP
jgi:hypothetical protein